MAQPSKAIFFLMPEWQGSASSRAMLLIDGAGHLRGDLPPSARIDVPIPAQAGDALGTPIARLSSVLAARDAAREALRANAQASSAITVGGDSASTLAGIERAVELDDRAAVLWFDAQPAFQHPSTSPTGAASGMTLRHALGEGSPELNSAHPLPADRVLLVGTREVDPEEAEGMSELLLRSEPAGDADEASFAGAIVSWLEEVGATSLYVHLDLDVLDPAEFASVHAPVPFGVPVAHLTAAIRAAVSRVPLAGAAICEFAPVDAAMSDEDAPTVLRILAALTSGGRE